ncbi:MAG: hypothetical protein ISS66_09005 [Desulfobacteraceae bacterium]|nr:hypothetical protein [Desulfobacteraceae bacterium]
MNAQIDLVYNYTKMLVPILPFHFDATIYKPDHFPSADSSWKPGIRWQTMLWQNKPLGLKFENQGDIGQPIIKLSIWSYDQLTPDFLSQFYDEITFRYCLQHDLTEFNESFKNDPHIGPILRRWSGMRPVSYSSLYKYLMVAIVLQNATVRRSVNMMRTLFEEYGTLLCYDGMRLFCSWDPCRIAQASEQELRNLKIGYRAKSIKRVTSAFVDKEIDEFELREKRKDEQKEALLNLYGIGPASVGYILFDVFHHWDALDHISPWEQKIYSKLFFNQEPENPISVEKLLKYFEEHYGKYKMLVVHYIWEDLFWKRQNESISWLEKLIRL